MGEDETIERPSRREFLSSTAGGLGGIALACLLQEEGRAAASPTTHFAPKAKRVVQIFCMGGVSHVDTFDYKSELARADGQEMTGKGKVDTFFGQPGRLMKSPFAFKQRGRSGLWASDLLPHLAGCMDDLTLLRSMTSKSSNHTPATFFMNTGFTMNGFPCLGAWLSYGLGTENRNLPSFVVLPDPRGIPAGGSINWTSGFLPAAHQGVAFGGGKEPVPDLFPPADAPGKPSARIALLDRMNRDYAASNPGDSALEARIRSYELAAQMQASIPEAVSFASESEETKRLYGLDDPTATGFARNCLMARRLLERGVRFVQVCHGGAFGGNPRINWDAHEDLVDNHVRQAGSMDRPVAALLKDLKARGMLHDTLLLWTTEFGRTPFTQGIGAKGRDHHQHAFTMWMAGAGLKPGFAYGASDELGYNVAENPVTVYDFHATVLHLLGLDHKRLTYYHNGIQRRLTDVHGNVIQGVLA